MKILVTTTGSKKNKKYIVQVLDGESSIHEESVDNVSDRDALVWKLADLYGAVDIEMKDVMKAEEFRFSEIPSIPVLEESEADTFFEEECEFVYDRILQAVEEGIKMDQQTIRLFELNGTDVYITSNKEDWKNGVEQALEYYVQKEQYDKCIQARQLMSKL
jgi:hypothetical protein